MKSTKIQINKIKGKIKFKIHDVQDLIVFYCIEYKYVQYYILTPIRIELNSLQLKPPEKCERGRFSHWFIVILCLLDIVHATPINELTDLSLHFYFNINF